MNRINLLEQFGNACTGWRKNSISLHPQHPRCSARWIPGVGSFNDLKYASSPNKALLDEHIESMPEIPNALLIRFPREEELVFTPPKKEEKPAINLYTFGEQIPIPQMHAYVHALPAPIIEEVLPKSEPKFENINKKTKLGMLRMVQIGGRAYGFKKVIPSSEAPSIYVYVEPGARYSTKQYLSIWGVDHQGKFIGNSKLPVGMPITLDELTDFLMTENLPEAFQLCPYFALIPGDSPRIVIARWFSPTQVITYPISLEAEACIAFVKHEDQFGQEKS